MRGWRMAWSSLVVLATLAVATTAAARAEDEAGRLIERPYTAVLEIYMLGSEFASEAPFAGETSDFGGACSEPVDMVFRSRLEGIDSVFGRFTGEGVTCIKAEWGVDANGAAVMTGTRMTDMTVPLVSADGSPVGTALIFQGEGFDAETGQITAGVSLVSTGGGAGRFEGATLFGAMTCRWVSREALAAGVEPEICVLHGTIRYDPVAVAGE
ncbi:MAG: hypothetical protein K0A98_08975 [Trueperaceae bacterium]|nr:hypothetical protein [Trueperaceae bacterium]